MDFLSQLVAGMGGESGASSALRFGNDMGGVAAEAITSIGARGIAKENAKTRKLVAKINVKRQSRDLRYQQGLATVANAGQGGYGNAVFQAAANARAASERKQDILLQAQQENRAERNALPGNLEIATNFMTGATEAFAKRTEREGRNG